MLLTMHEIVARLGKADFIECVRYPLQGNTNTNLSSQLFFGSTFKLVVVNMQYSAKKLQDLKYNYYSVCHPCCTSGHLKCLVPTFPDLSSSQPLFHVQPLLAFHFLSGSKLESAPQIVSHDSFCPELQCLLLLKQERPRSPKSETCHHHVESYYKNGQLILYAHFRFIQR